MAGGALVVQQRTVGYSKHARAAVDREAAPGGIRQTVGLRIATVWIGAADRPHHGSIRSILCHGARRQTQIRRGIVDRGHRQCSGITHRAVGSRATTCAGPCNLYIVDMQAAHGVTSADDKANLRIGIGIGTDVGFVTLCLPIRRIDRKGLKRRPGLPVIHLNRHRAFGAAAMLTDVVERQRGGGDRAQIDLSARATREEIGFNLQGIVGQPGITIHHDHAAARPVSFSQFLPGAAPLDRSIII